MRLAKYKNIAYPARVLYSFGNSFSPDRPCASSSTSRYSLPPPRSNMPSLKEVRRSRDE
jgi:hypothetical protein